MSNIIKRFRCYILCAYPVILLISCSPQHKGSIELADNTISYNVELIVTADIISFAIDDNVVNRTTCLFPYYDSDSTLSLYYLYNNTIYVFDVDSERLKNKNTLDFEGPNGVGEAKGFDVLSSDSILNISFCAQTEHC